MAVESKDASAPQSLPRGLATVALLKARFDEGVDHIDMFMPLVVDTVVNMPSDNFAVADVQQVLQERHGIAIPQHTLATLLTRAIRKDIVKREFSRYVRQAKTPTVKDLQAKKTTIEEQQRRLAREFRSHATQHGVRIDSDERALRLIVDFLQDNQVHILLGAQEIERGKKLSNREARLVAEFAQNIISTESDLTHILQNILEGLVIYNTAFLNDITSPARQFKGLRVFFDSGILCEILGYEGPAQAALAREILSLLKSAGVQCLAFDKTVHEVHGLLKIHETKMATTQGRKSLIPTPITRFFLTNRYSPSDLRQMSALLPQELQAVGIQIATMPNRTRRFTLDEKKLAKLLANERTGDEDAPRVIHDIDCVAAILTLRGGERSTSLNDVRAVFATSSRLVIANVQQWYDGEGETGVSPVIHIRALSNMAWLRKPALSVNLKQHELIALCHAALRPSRKTWGRFLQHLSDLEQSQVLRSDEAVAIVVSEMTDDLLGNIDDDGQDVDASTLDEIIERVRSSYEAEAAKQASEIVAEANQRVAEANARALELEADANKRISEYEAQVNDHVAEAKVQISITQQQAHKAVEEYRRLKLSLEGRATFLARSIARVAFLIPGLLIIGGAIGLIIGHPFHWGGIGIFTGIAIIAFVLLELLGNIKHIAHWRSKLEVLVLPWLRRAVGAEEPRKSQFPSVLGLDSTPSDLQNSGNGNN